MTELEEILKRNIVNYRLKFGKIPESSKYEKSPYIKPILLIQPTQMLVFCFNLRQLTVILLFHQQKYVDSSIHVYDGMEILRDFNNKSKELPLLKELPDRSQLYEALIQLTNSSTGHWGFIKFEGVALIFLDHDFSLTETSLAEILLDSSKMIFDRLKDNEKLKRTVGAIKQEVKEISSTDLRDRLTTSTQKLEAQIALLNNRVEEEINGFRTIIGKAKDFQDFRVFVNDVADLKNSHVRKEVFDSKICELNNRIESFKEIRGSYEKMLHEQTEFMKQQAAVINQQAGFMQWIKYATILLPIAVILVPVLEIIKGFLGL